MSNSVLFIISRSMFGYNVYDVGLYQRLIRYGEHTLCSACSNQVSIKCFSDELNVRMYLI